jgi:hypothetical protein
MSKRPSAKQNQSRTRSWRIFRLRGLYSQIYLLTGSRRTMGHALIDQELELLGAETETMRIERRRRELDEELRTLDSEAFDEITF